MTRENYLDIDCFCRKMKDLGMAAVVAASPNAVFHTSGCLIITHNPVRDRLAFCVTTADGLQYLIVCAIEVSLCEHDSWVRYIRSYIEFKELPTHLLATTLIDLGLSGKKVGIDLDYLRESYFRELKVAAQTVQFVPADELLTELRVVKPRGQIAHMRKAATCVNEAIDEVMRESLIGMTERQVRARLRRSLAEKGADGSYIIIAAGSNVTVPEHRANEHVLAFGEPLLLDAAVTYNGYVAEAAKTCILGAESFNPVETALDTVYQASASALTGGCHARDIYYAAESGARKAGGTLVGDWVGYSLSFGGKEPPFLTRNAMEVLKPGMTIVLDIGYMEPAGALLRKKNLWVVTDSGATELS